MKLLSVRLDTKEFNKILSNSVQYSYGFLDGIEMERIEFNRFLGGYATEALGKYIDAKARLNPQSLHHVYEWRMVGKENARLFKFNVKANQSTINITGDFLQSKTQTLNSDYIFQDKANIMENSIAVTIEPKKSNVLVFESDGETVFTTKSIFISHPGGDEVAGSFGKTVDDFFSNYFTNALLKPLINDLETADEYIKDFREGTKSGKKIGVRAGRKYLKVSGVVFE